MRTTRPTDGRGVEGAFGPVGHWSADPSAAPSGGAPPEGAQMSKRARKRRTRKKSGANHGRRPNA